jgi:hypothetical protein
MSLCVYRFEVAEASSTALQDTCVDNKGSPDRPNKTGQSLVAVGFWPFSVPFRALATCADTHLVSKY